MAGRPVGWPLPRSAELPRVDKHARRRRRGRAGALPRGTLTMLRRLVGHSLAALNVRPGVVDEIHPLSALNCLEALSGDLVEMQEEECGAVHRIIGGPSGLSPNGLRRSTIESGSAIIPGLHARHWDCRCCRRHGSVLLVVIVVGGVHHVHEVVNAPAALRLHFVLVPRSKDRSRARGRSHAAARQHRRRGEGQSGRGERHEPCRCGAQATGDEHLRHVIGR